MFALVEGLKLDGLHAEHLTDPVLWGGPTTDEGYLLTSCR